MSVLDRPIEAVGCEEARVEHPGDRVGPADLLLLAVRLTVAAVLCMRFLTAVIVVGWVARWMARNIHRGWWRGSEARGDLRWRDYVAARSPTLPAGLTPRWLIHERAALIWSAPRRDGRPAGWVTRLARVPRVLLGGLAANVRVGVVMLLASLVIAAPGSFLMMAGWQYGWDISFHKVYEQAFTGRITFLIGMIAFVTALLYLPLACPHLAMSGRLRDVFQVRLVRGMTRHSRLGLAVYAAAVVMLSVPAYTAWIRIYGLPNEPAFAWLEDATPEQVRALRDGYAQNMTLLIAPAYVFVHLLAAAVYRRALPTAVAREPGLREELPPAIATSLERLELLSSATDRRRMFVVRAVLGTARRGWALTLWWIQLAFWLIFTAQLLVAQFLHAHPFLIWFNPWLLGLPCARWYASW